MGVNGPLKNQPFLCKVKKYIYRQIFADKKSKNKNFIISLIILIYLENIEIKIIITIIGNWEASQPIFAFVYAITEPNKN